MMRKNYKFCRKKQMTYSHSYFNKINLFIPIIIMIIIIFYVLIQIFKENKYKK